MESALRIVSEWAFALTVELTNQPCNILVVNPTEQAYEIKSYHSVQNSIRIYLEDVEFDELLEGLVKA
jgi:hypothetical protein